MPGGPQGIIARIHDDRTFRDVARKSVLACAPAVSQMTWAAA
jgi:hypothetical protein